MQRASSEATWHAHEGQKDARCCCKRRRKHARNAPLQKRATARPPPPLRPRGRVARLAQRLPQAATLDRSPSASRDPPSAPRQEGQAKRPPAASGAPSAAPHPRPGGRRAAGQQALHLTRPPAPRGLRTEPRAAGHNCAAVMDCRACGMPRGCGRGDLRRRGSRAPAPRPRGQRPGPPRAAPGRLQIACLCSGLVGSNCGGLKT